MDTTTWTDEDIDTAFITIERHGAGSREWQIIGHIAGSAAIWAEFDTEAAARRHARQNFTSWPIQPAGTRQAAR